MKSSLALGRACNGFMISNLMSSGNQITISVIPANAGIPFLSVPHGIPAYAGMTAILIATRKTPFPAAAA